MRAERHVRALAGAMALVAGLMLPHADARSEAPAESDEAREVAFLIHRGTPDSLAAASLLAHLVTRPEGAGARPDPARLIERARVLAPSRPDLLWLQLRECERRLCERAGSLAARLQSLDPDNGFAWSSALRMPPDPPPEVATQILARMGAASRPHLYWNALASGLFDAMTHPARGAPPTEITRGADDRLQRVAGLLSAVDVPAVAPLARACRLELFEMPGRRAACTAVMSHLATSDSVIARNMSLTVQEGWWPPGSVERESLRRQREQQRYLTVASNRLRPGSGDGDAEARVAAMRRLPLEGDVERAMIEAFHEPLQRPADWQEPTAAP